MYRKVFFFIALVLTLKGLNAYESTHSSKKYKVSACAVFDNEEKFLKEWIEYHRLIGIDHFYLYNMQSTDRSTLQLQKYIRSGIVTLTSWPKLKHALDNETKVCAQSLAIELPAYEHAAKVYGSSETEWLVILDVNEFLLPGENTSIKELLDKYSSYPAIDLSTEHFDASNIDQVPGKKLVIETVNLYKSSAKHPLQEVKKTIFKPELCTQFTWPPYNPIFKDDQKAAVVSKKEMRVNHYTNRFNGTIIPKKTLGKAYVDNRYMPEQEVIQLLELGYEIEDEGKEIFRFIPELIKSMDSK